MDSKQTMTTYHGSGPEISILNGLLILNNREPGKPRHQTRVSNVLTSSPDPKTKYSMDPKPELEVSHPHTPSQDSANWFVPAQPGSVPGEAAARCLAQDFFPSRRAPGRAGSDWKAGKGTLAATNFQSTLCPPALSPALHQAPLQAQETPRGYSNVPTPPLPRTEGPHWNTNEPCQTEVSGPCGRRCYGRRRLLLVGGESWEGFWGGS
uniref:Uncharacterized protein n=1 Tax=Rousettus aegyptiacus TaxID=9407 RepID=A0A7J8GAV6_ROUAE|nr:hypothetical protein HJG63_011648 [Rousettus aegyptiacus]